MNIRELEKKLRAVGFEFDRQCRDDYELWRQEGSGRHVIVRNRPGAIERKTLHKIIRAMGLTQKMFDAL